VLVAVIGLAAAGPGVLLVSGRDAHPAEEERAAAAAPPVSVSASELQGSPDVPVELAPVPDAATTAQNVSAPASAPDVVPSPAPATETVSPPPLASPPVPVADAAPPIPAPRASPRAGYAVQVAAAQSLADAQAVVSALGDAGHDGYVLPITVGNVQHFRVRVGPFDSQREADERARALIGSGFPGAWVAR
jgi:cell division septation protein DedD